MKETIKTKIKSYSFWTSMAGALIILFESLGNIFGFSINADDITNVVMALCGVLVVLGVVTMPTKSKTNTTIATENSTQTAETTTENDSNVIK